MFSDILETETTAIEMVAASEILYGSKSFQVADALSWLARAIDEQGRLREGELIRLKILNIREYLVPVDQIAVSNTMVGLAGNLDRQRRFMDAEVYYKHAILLLRAGGPSAIKDLGPALVFYAENLEAQGRDSEGVAIRSDAVTLPSPADNEDRAQELFSAGLRYNDAGYYSESEKVLLRAKTILEGKGGEANWLLDINILASLASCYGAQGDQDAREYYLRLALVTAEERFGERSNVTTAALSNLAAYAAQAGQRIAAREALTRALAIVQGEGAASNSEAAQIMANLANVYEPRGNETRILSLLRQSMQIMAHLYGDDSAPTIGPSRILSHYYENMQQLKDQERVIRHIILISGKTYGAQSLETGRVILELASNLAFQERFDEVEPLVKQGLKLVVARLGENHPDVARFKTNYGWFLRLQGRFAESVALLRQARNYFIERARDSAGEPNANQGDAAGARNSSMHLSASLWRLSQTEGVEGRHETALLGEEAFVSAQTAGYLSVAAAMAHAEADAGAVSSGRGEENRLREALIQEKARLEAIEAQQSAGASSGQLLLTEKRLADVSTRLRLLNAKLRQEYPRYFELVNPPPIEVQDVQKHLKENQSLILIEQNGFTRNYHFPNDEDVFVFVVTKAGFVWSKAGVNASDLTQAVAGLRCSLDGVNCSGGNVAVKLGFDRAAAFKLYRALFGSPSVAAIIKTSPDWLIVTNGALTSLPLGVLVTGEPSGSDFNAQDLRSTDWLVRSKTITTLPSVASVIRDTGVEDISAASERPFIGFAPRFQGRRAEIRSGLSDNEAHLNRARWDAEAVKNLPVLTNREEIETMRAELGGDVYEGGEATVEKINSLNSTDQLRHANVIAFATHGLISGDLGLSEPALAMTPPDIGKGDNKPGGRGLLTASAISDLKFSADWIILSACNTASGITPGADGLSGLASSFFYAGAKSLLVSNWRIRDDVASRLSTQTIRNFHRNPKIGRAGVLREAEISLLDDTSKDTAATPNSSPSSWAPFTFVR